MPSPDKEDQQHRSINQPYCDIDPSMAGDMVQGGMFGTLFAYLKPILANELIKHILFPAITTINILKFGLQSWRLHKQENKTVSKVFAWLASSLGLTAELIAMSVFFGAALFNPAYIPVFFFGIAGFNFLIHSGLAIHHFIQYCRAPAGSKREEAHWDRFKINLRIAFITGVATSTIFLLMAAPVLHLFVLPVGVALIVGFAAGGVLVTNALFMLKSVFSSLCCKKPETVSDFPDFGPNEKLLRPKYAEENTFCNLQNDYEGDLTRKLVAKDEPNYPQQQILKLIDQELKALTDAMKVNGVELPPNTPEELDERGARPNFVSKNRNSERHEKKRMSKFHAALLLKALITDSQGKVAPLKVQNPVSPDKRVESAPTTDCNYKTIRSVADVEDYFESTKEINDIRSSRWKTSSGNGKEIGKYASMQKLFKVGKFYEKHHLKPDEYKGYEKIRMAAGAA